MHRPICIGLLLAWHGAGAAPLTTVPTSLVVAPPLGACLTHGDALALGRPFHLETHDRIYFHAAGFMDHDYLRYAELTRDGATSGVFREVRLRSGLRFVDMDGRLRDEVLVWGGVRESLRFVDLIAEVGIPEQPLPNPIEIEVLGAAPDPRVYDFDGDGRPEVLFRPHGLLAHESSPVIARDLLIHYYTREVPESLGAFIGDYDGDGRYESLRQDSDAALWRVHRIGGDLALSAPLARIPASTDDAWRVVGDVDGDGRDDLVSWAVDGSVTVRTGQRDATLTAPRQLLSVPRPGDSPGTFRPLVLGDLDGRRGAEIILDDGDAVLVLAAEDDAAEVVLEFAWTGTRTVRSIAVGDLDGDGANDLVRAAADCVGEAGSTRLEAWFVEPPRRAGGGGGAIDALFLLTLLGAMAASAHRLAKA